MRVSVTGGGGAQGDVGGEVLPSTTFVAPLQEYYNLHKHPIVQVNAHPLY